MIITREAQIKPPDYFEQIINQRYRRKRGGGDLENPTVIARAIGDDTDKVMDQPMHDNHPFEDQGKQHCREDSVPKLDQLRSRLRWPRLCRESFEVVQAKPSHHPVTIR
jgi:hypothetical protein